MSTSCSGELKISVAKPFVYGIVSDRQNKSTNQIQHYTVWCVHMTFLDFFFIIKTYAMAPHSNCPARINEENAKT